MKRIIQTTLLIIMASLLAGCTLARVASIASGPKTLTIEPGKIVFCGIHEEVLRLEMPLTLHNHTKGQASVRQIKISARIADKQVFTTSHDEELTIASDSERRLPVSIDIELANMAKGVLEGSPQFTFHAEALVDLGLLGRRVISFESVRKIFSPTKRRLSLKNISLRKSDLSALRLTMLFDRTEDPDDKVIRSSFSGSARISGIDVGSITQSREGAQMEAEVVIPTLSALLVTKRIVRTKTLSAKLDVLYEADTETMQYRIPYVFERDDIAILPRKKRQ